MPDTSIASSTQDIILRLQQLISNWGGAQRGQPLTDLHRECLDAVGKGSPLHYRLLPTHTLLVADLDATHLQQALRRFNGVGRSTTLEFRVTSMGALMPR